MQLEALIFDVDGTLAETEETHRAAFNAAFRDAGLDWHWDRELYGRLLKTTGGKERILSYLATNLRVAPSPDLDLLVTALHRRKTTLYSEMITKGDLDLRPGVRAVIEETRRQGIRVAIATTTSRANVESLVRATLGSDGLRTFEVIAAGDGTANKKPAPDVYLEVLAALGLEPSVCLAVEDSENGLRAAQAAAIPTLITRSSYSRGEDFSGAAAVVSDLTDLVSRGRTPLPAAPHDLLSAVRLVHAKSREVAKAAARIRAAPR